MAGAGARMLGRLGFFHRPSSQTVGASSWETAVPLTSYPDGPAIRMTEGMAVGEYADFLRPLHGSVTGRTRPPGAVPALVTQAAHIDFLPVSAHQGLFLRILALTDDARDFAQSEHTHLAIRVIRNRGHLALRWTVSRRS